jgi:glycerate-2-kinase
MVKYLRQAVASGSCLSQVLDGSAEAVARGAARCASPVLDRGPQATSAQAVFCGDATLSQQEKGNRQMSRRTE